MKLSKMDSAKHLSPDFSPIKEAQWLMQKHIGGFFGGEEQKPFAGRKNKPLRMSTEDQDLFWAQMIEESKDNAEALKGGHGVPLSSAYLSSSSLVVVTLW